MVATHYFPLTVQVIN